MMGSRILEKTLAIIPIIYLEVHRPRIILIFHTMQSWKDIIAKYFAFFSIIISFKTDFKNQYKPLKSKPKTKSKTKPKIIGNRY